MGKEKDFSRKSNLSQLSDDEILQGFKDADARIVREYYYGYCRVAYCIYDKRFDLQALLWQGQQEQHHPEDALYRGIQGKGRSHAVGHDRLRRHPAMPEDDA